MPEENNMGNQTPETENGNTGCTTVSQPKEAEPAAKAKPVISWKRELCILLIGMVCGATLFAIYSFHKIKDQVVTTCERHLRENLFLVYETDLAYEDAVSLFEKNAESLPGWSVNREYCQMPGNVTVFKMCHKTYAKKILNTEDRRLLASILPCSMAIYATEKGKTRLVRINPALLENVVDKENPAVFEKQIMPEQDVLLRQCGFKLITQ